MALVIRPPSDERGVVYAEFIMAFTPFFLLFLGIIQLAFLAAGRIVVQTAAMKSARAAVVILPDDRFFYDGEKEMLLDFTGRSDNSAFQAGLTDKFGEAGVDMSGQGALGGSGTGSAPGNGGARQSGNGGARLNAIRLAAQVTLAPLAPDPQLVATWLGAGASGGLLGSAGVGVERYSLRKTGIGESPLLRFVSGLFVYNSAATAINFPRAQGSKELWNAGDDFDGQVVFEHKQPVTVRVSYLFPCSVPLVNMIVCRKFDAKAGGLAGAFAGARDTLRDARDTLSRDESSGSMLEPDGLEPTAAEEAEIEELRAGVPDPDMLDMLLAAEQGRFYVLSAEMTLPIQSAAYAYPTADDFKERDQQASKSGSGRSGEDP